MRFTRIWEERQWLTHQTRIIHLTPLIVLIEWNYLIDVPFLFQKMDASPESPLILEVRNWDTAKTRTTFTTRSQQKRKTLAPLMPNTFWNGHTITCTQSTQENVRWNTRKEWWLNQRHKNKWTSIETDASNHEQMVVSVKRTKREAIFSARGSNTQRIFWFLPKPNRQRKVPTKSNTKSFHRWIIRDYWAQNSRCSGKSRRH